MVDMFSVCLTVRETKIQQSVLVDCLRGERHGMRKQSALPRPVPHGGDHGGQRIDTFSRTKVPETVPPKILRADSATNVPVAAGSLLVVGSSAQACKTLSSAPAVVGGVRTRVRPGFFRGFIFKVRKPVLKVLWNLILSQ